MILGNQSKRKSQCQNGRYGNSSFWSSSPKSSKINGQLTMGNSPSYGTELPTQSQRSLGVQGDSLQQEIKDNYPQGRCNELHRLSALPTLNHGHFHREQVLPAAMAHTIGGETSLPAHQQQHLQVRHTISSPRPPTWQSANTSEASRRPGGASGSLGLGTEGWSS